MIASLQPAKAAQAQAVSAGVVKSSGYDGDADDGGGSSRLLDIKA